VKKSKKTNKYLQHSNVHLVLHFVSAHQPPLVNLPLPFISPISHSFISLISHTYHYLTHLYLTHHYLSLLPLSHTFISHLYLTPLSHTHHTPHTTHHTPHITHHTPHTPPHTPHPTHKQDSITTVYYQRNKV
jgi:hypothetical protein